MRIPTVVLLIASAAVASTVSGQISGQVSGQISTTTLRAITTTQPSIQFLLADLNGNGVEISNRVTTPLLTGSPVSVRWVGANNPDRFLAIDATALRQTGFQLADAAGVTIDGVILAHPGLRLTNPGGTAASVSSLRDLLARLDANHDGKINASDPAWGSLRWFADANADGVIGPGELSSSATIGMQSISVAAGGAAYRDSYGNLRVPASGMFANGGVFQTIDANPATN